MKTILFFLGLIAFVLHLGAAEPARKYIGAIAEVRGAVFLRTNQSGPGKQLIPSNAPYQPLYLGDEARCAAGGSIRCYLLFGKDWTTSNTNWVHVPEVPRPTDERIATIERELANRFTGAGRPRGDAPRKRALLVGINTYRPVARTNSERSGAVEKAGAAALSSFSKKSKQKGSRGNWTDLDGCVNDVEAMREVLITRFGFATEDVLVLTNRQATRAGILAALGRHLVEPSQPGDVAFFFYAGHGSQVTNTKSDEADQKDETIVPADSCEGVPDIRDKELRRVFNAILSREARLTAIFDSCHSGSISRGGFPVETKPRMLPADPRQVADGSDPGPNPKVRGALVISASLPSQTADEQADARGTAHGAFSTALLHTLRSVDLAESAGRIFLRTKAALQSEGRLQEPVLDGSPERLRKSLLGYQLGATDGKISAAVLKAQRDQAIELQAGLAMGLSPGCELTKVMNDTSAPAPRIKITSVPGMARSLAERMRGATGEIKPGDLFEITRWVAKDEAILRVWVPPAFGSDLDLAGLVPELRLLRESGAIRWIDDPAEAPPTHILRVDENQWVLYALKNASATKLGKSLKAGAVLKAKSLRMQHEKPRLFVTLPPSQEMQKAMQEKFSRPDGAVVLAKSMTEAHYLLLGRMGTQSVEYSWVAPNTSANGAANSPMPERSDWQAAGQRPEQTRQASDQLLDAATTLQRVKAWLVLPSPPDLGLFPYRLLLTRTNAAGTRETKGAGGVVRDGEEYGLLLRADPARVQEGVPPRYVYVFIIDRFGRSNLLFPRIGGNDENRYPLPSGATSGSPIEIVLNSGVTIGPPLGVDTYFLLSTDQALPKPDIMQFDGVRRFRGGAESSDLSRLLEGIGTNTRGAAVATPLNWSLERLPIRSVEQDK